MMVAGHSFDENDICTCGRRWLDIMHVDMTYLDEEGWAHTGKLNAREINDIIAERTRREHIYVNATHNVAGGGYVAPAPRPDDLIDLFSDTS